MPTHTQTACIQGTSWLPRQPSRRASSCSSTTALPIIASTLQTAPLPSETYKQPYNAKPSKAEYHRSKNVEKCSAPWRRRWIMRSEEHHLHPKQSSASANRSANAKTPSPGPLLPSDASSPSQRWLSTHLSQWPWPSASTRGNRTRAFIP